jgi:hypothetical protein
LNEPFNRTREYVDGLTDWQVYHWHFRKYDREADAIETVERIEEEDREKPVERKREEFVALCRSFGHTEAQAEAEWRAWADQQGE